LSRILNWGILSTARIGVNSVIPAIKQSKNGNLVAIASRTQEKADRVGRSFGIPRCFSSYEGLLNTPEVEAVYIPLPNGLHKEWVIKAAEKGKHVLCEKPISVNAAECQDMIDSCNKNSVMLMEAFMYRFHPRTNALKKLLNEGALGRVSLVRSSFTILLNDPEDIRYKRNLGGGSLLDLGSYCVDIINSIIHDTPEEVHAVARRKQKEGVDVSFAGLVRFKSDSIGVLDCGFESPHRSHLEVVGDKGTLEVPNAFAPKDSPAMFLYNGKKREFGNPVANAYGLMVEHFSDCVLNNRVPDYTPYESLRNMQLIDDLTRSSKRSAQSSSRGSN
jgi:xylose dehydrogenase (NAD/NADP)